VFDTWKVPYTALVDSVVRAGRLRAAFDVIVLPDQSPHELLEGVPREYPAPYPGGLGEDGVKALRQFAEDGGTLVALNDASRFAVQQLLLPVRNVLEGVADDEFYAPGSIFRLELDPNDPIARGMPAQSIAWYEGGPAFEVLDSSAVRVVGRYPGPGQSGTGPGGAVRLPAAIPWSEHRHLSVVVQQLTADAQVM
jgi:hypothetical protein